MPQLPIDRWPSFYRLLPYGRIKTGYKVSEEDTLFLVPDEDQIIYLEQAFDYIDAGSSYREVCEWVGQKINKSIVHQTIANLYRTHRRPFLTGKTKQQASKNSRPITKAQKKLISEKAKARHAQKRADKAAVEYELNKNKLKPSDYTTPPVPAVRAAKGTKVADLPPVPPAVELIFKPNPGPQSDFLSATEFQVLYGGSAGGGKSYAMLADPMRYFNEPNFVGLLLRRTNDELRELIWESQKLYPKAFPGAKFHSQKSTWTFPSGAKFWMAYLDRDEDVLRYQGQAFTWIGVDELTQYPTSFAWEYLSSRVRSSDPKLQPHLAMRATTNPGGPGHQWVKKMFIDPEVAGKGFYALDENGEQLQYPDNHEDLSKRGKPLFKRKFIPARLKDNPYLAEDGSYERSLLGLPEDQRRKLLDGDWSVMEGAAFGEFSTKLHVCEPFDIPSNWRHFRSADYGYSSFSAVLWFAIDPVDDTLYVYRELYKSKCTGRDLAQKVLSMEADENISYGVLDSSVWHERGHTGPTVAEEMIAYGCRWRPSDRGAGSRSAGKNRLHELLKLRETSKGNKPGIMFFNTCRQLIADIPSLPSDPDGSDDIDSRTRNDHTYDALRYGIMSRPRSTSPLDWGSKPLKYAPADKVFGY